MVSTPGQPDSGVGKLDRTVQPVNTACGKGIHGESHLDGSVLPFRAGFPLLHAVHRAITPGARHSLPALLSVGAHQMARNVKLSTVSGPRHPA